MTTTAVLPAVPTNGAGELQYVELKDLHESSVNPRKHFDPKGLVELAESLKRGQLNPVLVRPRPQGGFEIAAGHRRRRAAEQAGLRQLLAIVRAMTDAEFLEVLTIENLQREDVHPLDEALGYQQLLALPGYDVEGVAAKIGKSVSYIYQRLKLVDLVPAAQKAFWDENLTAGHAILIARLQPKDQEEALREMAETARYRGSSWSVRDLARWVEREIHLDLHAAAFKKDDAELFPQAGACTTCPKRTGYNPALFPDIAKKDTCTDRACFHKKVELHVVARREELQTKGEKVAQVSFERHSGQLKGKDTLGFDQWHECAKKAQGATPAIIVDGNRAGQTTYATRERESVSVYRPNPGDRARQEQANREGRIRSSARRRLWAVVFDKVTPRILNNGGALQPDEELLVVQQMFRRLWNEHQKHLCQLNGWELQKGNQGAEAVGVKAIAELEPARRSVLMLQCALIPHLDGGANSYWTGEDRDRLKWMAERLKLDPKAIEREVRAEVAAKAKGKKPVVQTSAKPKQRAGDVARAKKAKRAKAAR